MGTDMRPPDEVFCMQCGPGMVLQSDRQVHLLRCPSCGATHRLPGRPLFVVTGASGAGKSTIVEPLRRRLPDCEVFETDIILHVAALGWDTWRNTWLQLAHVIALNGRATVLCGSLLPEQLEGLPARRGWSEATIVEHQRFAAWLRTQIQPTFDTSVLSVEEVADRIAGGPQAAGRRGTRRHRHRRTSRGLADHLLGLNRGRAGGLTDRGLLALPSDYLSDAP